MLPLPSDSLPDVPGRPHPRPIYRLSIDGKDITDRLQGRLESLTLTDNRGFEADQLDLVLDDSDGQLDIPDRGVKLSLSIGWADTGLIDKGLFTVDDVEHSGAPDKLTLRARSADLRKGLIQRQERSFHGNTLGDIVRTVASANSLEPLISEELDKQVVDHIDQTSESDANLLTRLAEQFDAIATVKQGKLLFMVASQATTASGQPLPSVVITRASGDSHRFAVSERETYTGVKAYYQDTASAKKGEVFVDAEYMKNAAQKKKTETAIQPKKTKKKKGQKDAPSEVQTITPSTDSIKVLRHTYANHNNAIRAAKSEWNRLQRGFAQFSLTLALGNPELFPELPVTVQGFKPKIDGTDWIIIKATHNLSDSGYTTSLEFEVRSQLNNDVNT